MSPDEAHLSNHRAVALIDAQVRHSHLGANAMASELAVAGADEWRAVAMAAVHEAVLLARTVAQLSGRSVVEVVEGIEAMWAVHDEGCAFSAADRRRP